MNNSVRLINSELINDVRDKALNAPRKRLNYNFHQLDETYQRFLNILCKGTYVRPHRHTTPPKAETFLILEGKISFLIFSEEGNVIESHILEAGGPNYGIDILPGVWHSLVCISEPFDPTKTEHSNSALESFLETSMNSWIILSILYILYFEIT